MPRKRQELKPGEGLHVTMRLDAALAARLDRLVDGLAESTGLTVTRVDVMRMLMKEALDTRETRTKPKK